MSLSNQIKELIAIGASVTANCQPCIQYHSAKARELGLDDAEIREAVNMGKTVRKGAAAHMDNHINALNGQSCGCGANPCAPNPCAETGSTGSSCCG
ncbi:MAG TPA: carboxymuconolactone decarboxylase family protein [Patescibacteria group bacterium]|nr:carboxymuconolactone decarboxylase family protein [Patescibacteria group bacterium]